MTIKPGCLLAIGIAIGLWTAFGLVVAHFA